MQRSATKYARRQYGKSPNTDTRAGNGFEAMHVGSIHYALIVAVLYHFRCYNIREPKFIKCCCVWYLEKRESKIKESRERNVNFAFWDQMLAIIKYTWRFQVQFSNWRTECFRADAAVGTFAPSYKTGLSKNFRSKYSSMRLSFNSSCFLHTLSFHNTIWKISMH